MHMIIFRSIFLPQLAAYSNIFSASFKYTKAILGESIKILFFASLFRLRIVPTNFSMLVNVYNGYELIN